MSRRCESRGATRGASPLARAGASKKKKKKSLCLFVVHASLRRRLRAREASRRPGVSGAGACSAFTERVFPDTGGTGGLERGAFLNAVSYTHLTLPTKA